MDEVDDERKEELSSLAAIFPEIQVSSSDKYAFSLDIPVTPAKSIRARFSANDTDIELSHLPSLTLHMSLPEGYPVEKAPQVSLSSNPPWIPKDKLDELKKQSTTTWEQYGQSQMAFDYIDSLQQAAEQVFDLLRNGMLELHESMKSEILRFNKDADKKAFDIETFDCEVCLDPKKGADCHKMHKCGHVFCIDCIRGAYDSAIAEGDVSSVKCLFPDCGVERDAITKRATKAAPTLGPDELLEIPIAYAAVERYVKLKRKKRFESFPKTVYCPRKWCQGVARGSRFPRKPVANMTADDLEPEAILAEKDAEPKDLKNNQDRLRICEDCDLAFCRVCLATWHGEYVPRCWPRTADELTEDEKASYSYLMKHTSPCPSCDFAIQKSMGCNHITCFNCRHHFCYLCSSWLDPSNPYEHFNKKGTPCYQRLWDMEGGDDADGNVQFLGIRGAEMAAALAEEEALAEAQREQDNQNNVDIDAAQQAVGHLNIQDAPIVVANLDLDDEPDWWHPAPANWRNDNFEAAQARNPRQPRHPAMGGGFRPHNGEGHRRGHNRRMVARQGAQEARDAQILRQAAIARVVAQQNPRNQAEAVQMAAGLDRFLQMAAEDREDEWDSDELEGDDDLWAIPDAPPRAADQPGMRPLMPFLAQRR